MADFDDFMDDGELLSVANNLLSVMKATDQVAEDILPSQIVEIVKFHAKGAAAAGVASGWIPGVGGTAMALTCAGFVWSMYARINNKLGLKLSDNILKTLASGVATNLATYIAGSIIATTALSFIPFLGSAGASVIAGGVSYAMGLVSGYVYLKIMTKIFQSGNDFSKYNADELKDLADEVIENENIEEMLKEAKDEYVREKRK